ncbi:hypothetical protein OTU49_005333 [Cherax quadricarinatus]|uniref:Uncharacterized protein n=1 Tax=Cherax quadricarinatus TaxID=27406 RepID=A0AAW0X8V9_CHEQU
MRVLCLLILVAAASPGPAPEPLLETSPGSGFVGTIVRKPVEPLHGKLIKPGDLAKPLSRPARPLKSASSISPAHLSRGAADTPDTKWSGSQGSCVSCEKLSRRQEGVCCRRWSLCCLPLNPH